MPKLKFRFLVLLCLFVSGCAPTATPAPTPSPIPPTVAVAPTASPIPPSAKPSIVLPTPTTPQEMTGWAASRWDLYGINVQLPPNWFAAEFNRRPESNAVDAPKLGHDCADYQIADATHAVTILLLPTCGFADGGPGEWRDGTVLVRDTEGRYLTRFYDAALSRWVYSDGGLMDNRPFIYDPPIVVLRHNDDLLFMTIVVTYAGEPTDALLLQADQVVAALVFEP